MGPAEQAYGSQIQFLEPKVARAANGMQFYSPVVTISPDPVSQNIDYGQPVTFSVNASSLTSLGYQWRFNGTPIPGASAFATNISSYSIASVVTTNGGFYDCVVTNTSGSSATSHVATLTIGAANFMAHRFSFSTSYTNTTTTNFYTPDSVAYTGTHDNNTTRGWLEGLQDGTAEQVREYFQLTDSLSAWPVIRAALATVSRLAVIPIQDLLDLPALSALNQPGTAEGNWQWRYTDEQLSRLAAEKLETLRHWIRLYDRTGERVLREYSEAPVKTSAAT